MALYKLPLILTRQPEGGYTVTSPVLPELVTEGDTLDDALANLRDALEAVREAYDDVGRPFPANLQQDADAAPIRFEYVVDAA